MSTEKANFSELFFTRILSLQKDMNAAEFCRYIGVSTPLYQKWKRGAVPRIEKLKLISEKFGVSVGWLLTGRDDVTTKLSYGIRERLFEAKGATGLSVPELANLMGVDVKDVERVMNTGGSVSGAFLEAFERGLQPRIDAIKTRKAVVAPCPNCARLESELTRANRIIDTILKK